MPDSSAAAILREATALWWAIVPPLALQATVTLLAAAALDALLPRRAWPELRAAVWVVALARLIVPADLLSVWHAASLALPYWPRAIDAGDFADADAESAAIAGAEAAFVVWGWAQRRSSRSASSTTLPAHARCAPLRARLGLPAPGRASRPPPGARD